MKLISKLFISGAISAVCLAAPTAAFASPHTPPPVHGWGNCQTDPGNHNYGDPKGGDQGNFWNDSTSCDPVVDNCVTGGWQNDQQGDHDNYGDHDHSNCQTGNCDPQGHNQYGDYNQYGDHNSDQGNCNTDPGYGDHDNGPGCHIQTITAFTWSFGSSTTFSSTTKVTLHEVLSSGGQSFTVTSVTPAGSNYIFKVNPSVPSYDIHNNKVVFTTTCDAHGDGGHDGGH